MKYNLKTHSGRFWCMVSLLRKAGYTKAKSKKIVSELLKEKK